MAEIRLTAKQEAFCNCIADGMTQSDAYRTAYNASRMTDKSIWEAAAKLIDSTKVAARLAEIRKSLEKKQLWTRAESVTVLSGIARDDEHRPADRISAVKELNATHGYDAPENDSEEAEPLTINFQVKQAVSEIKITNAQS